MTSEHLGRHLDVDTCIACGARHRVGECGEGCTDVALDLVEVADLVALEDRRDALQRRTDALRGAIEAWAAHPDEAWKPARATGHEALTLAVPPQPPPATVVQAWGCPTCGRVDAPQPCLDVCIRRPVEMADAAEYDELAAEVAEIARREEALAQVVSLIVHVRPRADAVDATRSALRARVDEALRA